MIRKLASGKYRLYSRKKNPKTDRRRNLGTFASRAEARARGAIFQAGVIFPSPCKRGRGTARSAVKGACEATARSRN
jgi:hypothetical protein